MGMSIDESERLLRNHLDGVTNYCERELTDKAIQVAISTMRKYQKIQEIVKFGNANELGFEYVGEKITEVMEDGKV